MEISYLLDEISTKKIQIKVKNIKRMKCKSFPNTCVVIKIDNNRYLHIDEFGNQIILSGVDI